MGDAGIIQAIRKRDEITIGEVITKYSRLLWSVAGAVLDNVGSVQDVEGSCYRTGYRTGSRASRYYD